MGKIIASYLIKVHLHLAEDDEEVAEKVANGESFTAPTNDAIKDLVIDAIQEELGGEVTVSLIERTDD